MYVSRAIIVDRLLYTCSINIFSDIIFDLPIYLSGFLRLKLKVSQKSSKLTIIILQQNKIQMDNQKRPEFASMLYILVQNLTQKKLLVIKMGYSIWRIPLIRRNIYEKVQLSRTNITALICLICTRSTTDPLYWFEYKYYQLFISHLRINGDCAKPCIFHNKFSTFLPI